MNEYLYGFKRTHSISVDLKSCRANSTHLLDKIVYVSKIKDKSLWW